MASENCDGGALAVIRHVHVHRDEDRNTDSIEIGTPGKGGVLKVYVNTDDPEAAARRIETAFSLRQYARDLDDGTRQAGAQEPQAGTPAAAEPAQVQQAPAPAKPDADTCADCGAPIAEAQAKMTRLFANLPLCKGCYEERLAQRGSA